MSRLQAVKLLDEDIQELSFHISELRAVVKSPNPLPGERDGLQETLEYALDCMLQHRRNLKDLIRSLPV